VTKTNGGVTIRSPWLIEFSIFPGLLILLSLDGPLL